MVSVVLVAAASAAGASASAQAATAAVRGGRQRIQEAQRLAGPGVAVRSSGNGRSMGAAAGSAGADPTATRRASDVFAECLEAEGVKYVFGIPGEETLDLNESLQDSAVDFVAVRHEQGGAYMADIDGRLTGRAGVCLGLVGAGGANRRTAGAAALL